MFSLPVTHVYRWADWVLVTRLSREVEKVNPKYSEFVQSMTNRDNTLVALAVIAVCLITAWVLVDVIIPIEFRGIIKRAYMIGGLGLFLISIMAVLA
jgi:hypothetical protein